MRNRSTIIKEHFEWPRDASHLFVGQIQGRIQDFS